MLIKLSILAVILVITSSVHGYEDEDDCEEGWDEYNSCLDCEFEHGLYYDEEWEDGCYGIVPWSSYTYFYLNDERANGLGKAHGQNALLGCRYFATPCLSVSLYGIYERSKNTSRVEGATAFLLGRRAINHTEGWGGGVEVDYELSSGLISCINFAYVSTEQKLRTIDLGGFVPDILSHTSGHRWQLTSGFIYTYPFPWATFTGNANYLYISSRWTGFIDSFDQELTGQNSALGIGNVNGALFFRPCSCFKPFVGGGVACDITQGERFPIFITQIGSSVSNFPLRRRFEWNGCIGFLVTKGCFSFSGLYAHKRRGGPINTDILTVCASLAF